MHELPAPLTPAGCSTIRVGDFSIRVIQRSALKRIHDDTAFRAAFNLLFAAWHQDERAASIPDDDEILAAFAGFGHRKGSVRRWLKVRDEALKGWVKCSDGRLYEPNLAAEAIELWACKLLKAVRSTLAWNEPASIERLRGNLQTAYTALPGHSRTKERIRRALDKLDPNLARRLTAGLHALRVLNGGAA